MPGVAVLGWTLDLTAHCFVMVRRHMSVFADGLGTTIHELACHG